MIEENTIDKIAERIKCIAHPVRLRILLLLAQHGKLYAAEIEDIFNSPQGSVISHLIKMKGKGILTSQRQGHIVYYSLVDANLIQAIQRLII